ncbi:MAG: LPS export ABC transporter permease LptF [Paracoccus sp. (in: a-proteobacteria)]|nr:LPS export ABC transporter permease LptF [Paracoccus sp. (in: a-proteobacteria)]
MSLIDRYILRVMLTLFGFFALVLVAVYWINRAVSLFERLIADGQTALVVLEFTLLTLPVVIATVLPLAAFTAVAYGTNRLSAESELVAMQAAGLSPWRLARPVLAFGLIVALMVTALVHGLVPMARERLADRQAEIAENITAQFLIAGSFQFPANGVTLFIREISPNGALQGLFLEDAGTAGRLTTYTAEEALIVRTDAGPKLIMVAGMIQQMRPGPDGAGQLSVTRFEDLTYDLGALVGAPAKRGRDLRDYSTARLLAPDAALLEATGASPARARLEAHERIAQPLLSPVAAMLGFATLLVGGFSRFGVWRQVGWATLALIFVQFLANWTANRAGKDPDLWPIVYLPSLIGALICAAILWLAARPRRPRGGSAATPATNGAAP